MVKKKIFLTFIILMIIRSVVISQSLKIGFRVEPSFLLTEHKNENSISFTPYSFYFTTLLEPINWLEFEIRPGYLLGGEEYSGFEIGAFLRFNIIPTKFFITAGLSNHSNQISGHNSGGSYGKNMLFNSVSIGFRKDSKLSIDLMYCWANDKDYAYTFENIESVPIKINKKIDGIIKIGVCITFDIL